MGTNLTGERRQVRYVLLLSPTEMELFKAVAARDYRSLPDFLRAHIYERAEMLRIDKSPDRVEQPCAAFNR